MASMKASKSNNIGKFFICACVEITYGVLTRLNLFIEFVVCI